MRLLLLQIVASLLVPQIYAAERLLIMDVYARVVPAGQIAPIPDPFIEAVVRGETPVSGDGIQAFQGKSFQVSPKFQDFAPVVAGVEGQKISIQFTAAVLTNGNCAVTQYRAIALAKSSKGETISVGSSETVSRAGFIVTPGSRVTQSVSAQSGGSTVVYYLIFSAARGVGE
jgi:hypothetical protein